MNFEWEGLLIFLNTYVNIDLTTNNAARCALETETDTMMFPITKLELLVILPKVVFTLSSIYLLLLANNFINYFFLSVYFIKYIRKFLGRSIHPKPRRLVWKYVEFDTSKCVDKYPYETTHFIIEICGFPRFPYIINFHWKSVEFYSGIRGIHPQILLRNSRNY
jgi:hypothetical protein